MIRAVFQNGVIQPLDPIPNSWADGTELTVGEVEVVEAHDLEEWRQELEVLTRANSHKAFVEVQQFLAERDLIDKEMMRREMEIPL